MPDPRSLQIGDRIRFLALPDEWRQPGCTVHRESRAFMKLLISRRRIVTISSRDDYGQPWFQVRLRADGRMHEHSWAVMETTGWRKVRCRGR